MRWLWDPDKNARNKRIHRISFETARLVFDDPHAVTDLDPFPGEERWRTIGLVGHALLFVVHTWPSNDGSDESGRIISARRASARERRLYENG